jgi:hypothetical protein
MLVGLALTAFAGTPLIVNVDPKAVKVVLDCGGQKLEAPVKNGVASFEAAPAGCQVGLVMPAGQLDGAGTWTCTATGTPGCHLDEFPHAAISNGPGKVNVVLTGKYDTQWLELKCGETYRERGDIAENTTTFASVPSGDCQLYFKGASPAQFRPITAGKSYRCSLIGTTAVCENLQP